METLIKKLRVFAGERDWEKFHSPKNLSMALGVEVSEVMEHFQWLTEEESRNLTPEKKALLEGEIGDVMIYLVRLADTLGIDPLDAALKKAALNEKRYPVNKSYGKARKYSDL
jgi:NTP pyrophosphatase (non-canonical NTP hydrolase)